MSLYIMTTILPLHAELARNLHRYMWANYYQFDNNLPTAYQWYQQITDTKGSVYTHKGYIHLLDKAGQYEKITQLAQKKDKFSQKTLDEIFSKDPDVQLIFAQAFKKIGNTQEADRRVMSLSHQFKNHP